jgi:outer membrane protein
VRNNLAAVALLLGAIATKIPAQEMPTAPDPTVPTVPTPKSTPTGMELTVQQAEAIALRNNPQITVGRLRALQSRESVREARSALLPQAYLSVTGVESDAGSRISAGYITNPTVYPRAASGTTVNQLVTDFGRTKNLVSSQQYQAKAADETALATQQQIILAVDQAFYNALETKALRQVAEETVSARRLLVDQIQALTTAKLRSDLDLSFSQVDLGRAKLLLLESRNNYEASLSVLSAILGFPGRQDFTLVETTAPEAPPAPDATALIQQALQTRPEVKALQDEVSSATKFSKAEHDLWWPTVNATGVVGLAPVRDPHLSSWYGAVGVNINIPVFNGFLFNARAKTADLETRAQQQHLLDLQNGIARDVRNAWLDTQKAFERLSVTKQLREQANLALQLAQARYKLGLGSIVEYSQANLQKTQADLEDTDAHYQYQVTQIILGYQVGVVR